jgi:hypothetical protein
LCYRFVHRTPEELHHQANVSGPLPQRSIPNFPLQNAPELDVPPEHSPSTKTSLLDRGCSSVAGTTDSSESGLSHSPTVACMAEKPSTAVNVNVVQASGNGNQNQNTSIEISAGSISSSHSMQMVVENKKEGVDTDSYGSLCVESNDISMETSAGSSEAALAPLSEHKKPNEEIILVSCYKNWSVRE